MTKELAIQILRGEVLGTNEQTHEAVFMAIKALKNEQKHGKWISVPHKKNRICSVCECDEPYKFADENADIFDFCPNCGAKMKRSEE